MILRCESLGDTFCRAHPPFSLSVHMRCLLSSRVLSALIGLAACTPSDAATARGNAMTECREADWSSPVTARHAVTGSKDGLRDARAIGRGEHLYIVGNSLETRASPTRAPSLEVLDGDGRSLGRPLGDFVYAFPLGTVDDAGRLHLLWGEPEPGTWPNGPPDWTLQTITSVWTATYEPTLSRWSEPVRLYHDQSAPLWWAPQTADPVWRDSESFEISVLQPITPIGANEGLSSVILFVWKHAEWSIQSIPLPGSAVLASIARDGDRLWVFYIGQLTRRDRFPSVVVMQSPDGGKAWSAPEQWVQLPANAQSQALFAAVADRVVYAVWREDHSAEPVIRVRTKTPADSAWSSPSDLAIPGHSGAESFAMRACGELNLTIEVATGRQSISTMHVTWKNGEWSSFEEFHPAYRPLNAHLSTLPDGQLAATFLGSPDRRDDPLRPISFVSRLLPR